MVKRLSCMAFMLLALLFTSCGSVEDSTETTDVTGPETDTKSPDTASPMEAILSVQLTDKPAEYHEEVFVTVESVRIHQSADAAETDGSWRDLPVTANMPVDLLTLRNGVHLQLCETVLTAGQYQQIRLLLTANTGYDPPYKNYLTDADGVTHPLEVPSGTIKIVHEFSVENGATTNLVLDFDADESVKRRGDGTYYMEPVIKGSSSKE